MNLNNVNVMSDKQYYIIQKKSTVFVIGIKKDTTFGFYGRRDKSIGISRWIEFRM